MDDPYAGLHKWTVEIIAAPTLEAAWATILDPEPPAEPVPRSSPVSYGELVRVLSAFPEMLTVQEQQLVERISSFHTVAGGDQWQSPPGSDDDLCLLVDARQLRALLRRALLRVDEAQPASPDGRGAETSRRALDFLDILGPTHRDVALTLVWGW